MEMYDIALWAFALWYDCGVAMGMDCAGEAEGIGGWEWTMCFEVCTMPGLRANYI